MVRMSASSPSDLAVAFRSLPRRLTEAKAAAPSAVTGQFERDLQHSLVRGGELMHTPAGPLLIAEAIDRRRPEEWSDTDLETLRDLAVDIGRTLRALTDAVEALDD